MKQPTPSKAIGLALPAMSCFAPVANKDHVFIMLLNGFRSSGGLQRLTALQAARRDAWRNDAVQALPSRIAEREVLGIIWDHVAWVPDFQFDRCGAVKQAATAVFLELGPSYDPWELATWFVRASTWLQTARPIDVLERAPAHVLEAARADRYVANGG